MTATRERDADRARWSVGVTALLSQPSIAAAAKVCRVDESTLRRWLRKPKFLALLRTARRQLVDAATGRLVALASTAVETIERLLKSDNPGVALRAAALVVHEMREASIGELASSMEELEREAAEAKRQGGAGR